jgi:hypothetical protein
VIHIRRFGPVCLLLVLSLSGLPAHAQTADVDLQGRVFQSSDGALWVYKDGVKYPVLGLDLSDDQINAIPAIVDQPVERVNELFAPAAAQPAPPPPPPAPVIDVGNPHPNERIPAGLNMQGVAYDPLASSGSGIDRVQVFMEDRETGGVHLGDAALGGPITNGWQIVVNLPLGPHNLFVYARSAVTGAEGVAVIPVVVSNF